MRLIGKQKLEKFKRKKKGDLTLSREIDDLINDIETNDWSDQIELKNTRADADCVHSDGFYFFDIKPERTMVLIEFEEKEATVAWVGNHQDYEYIFKNNKETIKKWLKKNNWI